jgi:hypothetical protein
VKVCCEIQTRHFINFLLVHFKQVLESFAAMKTETKRDLMAAVEE